MKISTKILDSRLLCQEFYPTMSISNAGLDLRACLEQPSIALAPGNSEMISSGIAVAIPDGFFGMVVPRSGMGSKGLHLKNTVGIIDASYRGPILMNMINNGEDFIQIKALERVAQMLILPYRFAEFAMVEELPSSDRAAGGFGSTGSK